MNEKVCVVTGANSGVGFEASRLLAQSGATVVLVCRGQGRGETATDGILRGAPHADLRLQVADLASLAQVRRLGGELAQTFPEIHLLVNNAGLYRAKLERTEDGYERTFAVNHLSHFLLTQLLLPNLLAASGRVINVTSGGHRGGRLDPDSLEEVARGRMRYSGLGAYADSKLANVLFAAELARRFGSEELAACALHPGVLATQIWNRNRNPMSLGMLLFKPFMGRPSVGGEAVAFLAQEPAARIHGRYFEKKKEVKPAPLAEDPILAQKLWDLSLQLTGLITEPEAGP
jgi:NAD(P)-dependent dehydrogenase (short-subunit alcohol dehydrogenase family)